MGDEKDKSTDALLEKSSLYQQYLAEREEVLRHKWLESERAGRDIGFERALRRRFVFLCPHPLPWLTKN